MTKKLLFISHISEEREIAIALKECLQEAFLGFVEIFVSSDPDSIQLGSKWLERIETSLKKCSIEIVIASPVSVKRPWVNFEAGSGWVRGIPVIPVCHSGLVPDKLPKPLDSFQAALATESESLRLLLPVIARSLESHVPTVDFSKFVSTVKSYESTTTANSVVVEEQGLPSMDGLADHEIQLLFTIAYLVHNLDEAVSNEAIRSRMDSFSYTGIAVSLALKMLLRKELIFKATTTSFGEEVPGYMLSDEGWMWLQRNQKLAILRSV